MFALLASLVVAAAALAARSVLWLPPRYLLSALPWLQALAAGLLAGDALLHMLPEASPALALLGPGYLGGCLAAGLLGLLTVECVVRWWGTQGIAAPFARMDVIGDAMHHLVDGVVIGAAFTADERLGWLVALAIAAHELPREVSNMAVLVAGGYLPRRAFFLSLATAAALPVGTLITLAVGHGATSVAISLAVAAGATLYLACGDLLPAVWARLERPHTFAPAVGVGAGLVLMWLAAWLEPGRH